MAAASSPAASSPIATPSIGTRRRCACWQVRVAVRAGRSCLTCRSASRSQELRQRRTCRISGAAMSKVLAGVLPVLVTPFAQTGGFDTAALASEVDFVITHGAHGVVLGMVSEVLRLSSEERDGLTEETCKAVDGRVSVTASVGAESLHTAVRHAKHAQAVGADAVMA